MKQVMASGDLSFTYRPQDTMGDVVLEIFSSYSGKRLFTNFTKAGQQELVMKESFFGTFSINSSASCSVVISAPMATSTTSEKPIFFNAAIICAGVIFIPNCPTNEGASMATTGLRCFKARSRGTIMLRSSSAPKGQAARQLPQFVHFS